MSLATRPDRGRFKDVPALIPGAPAWPGVTNVLMLATAGIGQWLYLRNERGEKSTGLVHRQRTSRAQAVRR